MSSNARHAYASLEFISSNFSGKHRRSIPGPYPTIDAHRSCTAVGLLDVTSPPPGSDSSPLPCLVVLRVLCVCCVRAKVVTKYKLSPMLTDVLCRRHAMICRRSSTNALDVQVRGDRHQRARACLRVADEKETAAKKSEHAVSRGWISGLFLFAGVDDGGREGSAGRAASTCREGWMPGWWKAEATVQWISCKAFARWSLVDDASGRPRYSCNLGCRAWSCRSPPASFFPAFIQATLRASDGTGPPRMTRHVVDLAEK